MGWPPPSASRASRKTPTSPPTFSWAQQSATPQPNTRSFARADLGVTARSEVEELLSKCVLVSFLGRLCLLVQLFLANACLFPNIHLGKVMVHRGERLLVSDRRHPLIDS